MKKQRILALMIALVMLAFTLTGCGTRGSTNESGDDETITIKIAHTDSGTRSTNVAALEFKEFMESETNGRVTVEVYANGELGDDEDLLKGLQLGTCQIYIGSETTVSGLLGSQYGFVELPYLYENYEAWEKGTFEMGGLALYQEMLQGTGFNLLDFQFDGMRAVLTTKKPIKGLADFAGQKIRVNNTETYLATYKEFKGNPTPMAFGEVYTGLAQGTIDGVDHCLGVMVDQKFYEPTNYLALLNHFNIPLAVMSSEDFVQSLPEDIKVVFDEGIAKMGESQRAAERALEQECIQIMRDAGLEVTEMDEEKIAEFKDAVVPVYEQFRASVGDEIMEKVLATTQ